MFSGRTRYRKNQSSMTQHAKKNRKLLAQENIQNAVHEIPEQTEWIDERLVISLPSCSNPAHATLTYECA